MRGKTVMNAFNRRALRIFLPLVWTAVATAQTTEEDLIRAYGDKSTISIATGSLQNITRAPAVATVITASDISNMGATDLDQALESVPGLHVSKKSLALTPIYSFRGIFTGENPQVLMLVNGIPITNTFIGNRSQVWGGMPLENVARIEVIRGPNSALYGADAFSGVINVITKTAAEINGTEYGLRAGSFNSHDAWLQHGGKLGVLDAAFYLRAGDTDGHKGIIQQDAQSTWDAIFGTNVSNAPGPIDAERKAIDARADLSKERWRLRAGYQQRELGVGAGLAGSLDHDARVDEARLYLDLSYEHANWAPNWDTSAIVGYFDIREEPADPAFTLFPPGAFGGVFPISGDGMIGNPGHSEQHTHAGVTAFYTGFENHRVRIGAGHQIEDLYKTEEFKNFTYIGGVLTPLPTLVDATGNPDLIYIMPHKRNLSYVFAQDEWGIAKDWMLTATLISLPEILRLTAWLQP